MAIETAGIDPEGATAARAVGVSIVMPCLNEELSLPHCLLNARAALAAIEREHGLTGEIIIADNGSTDGSQALAARCGARVVDVPARGYGAALIGGGRAARGRYILMGDADGSYDFTDGVAMIGRLAAGADLCMGSRFKGGIEKGAMPWKNRHIGNPALTGILNLFFGAGISDAHCGLRALTKEAFDRLELSGSGMEFASEMVIKASLKGMKIAETPARLRRDLRDRPPHLRPWRDGWRHLRYLVMLSPTWAFGVPAIAAMTLASVILGYGVLNILGIIPGEPFFGASWSIAAGFLFVNGHLAALMALAAHLYGVRTGYRRLRPIVRALARFLTLEFMLVSGAALIFVSLASYAAIAGLWAKSGYVALPNVLPLVLAAVAGATGAQMIFGGFLMGVVMGHQAEFVEKAETPSLVSPGAPAPHSTADAA